MAAAAGGGREEKKPDDRLPYAAFELTVADLLAKLEEKLPDDSPQWAPPRATGEEGPDAPTLALYEKDPLSAEEAVEVCMGELKQWFEAREEWRESLLESWPSKETLRDFKAGHVSGGTLLRLMLEASKFDDDDDDDGNDHDDVPDPDELRSWAWERGEEESELDVPRSLNKRSNVRERIRHLGRPNLADLRRQAADAAHRSTVFWASPNGGHILRFDSRPEKVALMKHTEDMIPGHMLIGKNHVFLGVACDPYPGRPFAWGAPQSPFETLLDGCVKGEVGSSWVADETGGGWSEDLQEERKASLRGRSRFESDAWVLALTINVVIRLAYDSSRVPDEEHEIRRSMKAELTLTRPASDAIVALAALRLLLGSSRAVKAAR